MVHQVIEREDSCCCGPCPVGRKRGLPSFVLSMVRLVRTVAEPARPEFLCVLVDFVRRRQTLVFPPKNSYRQDYVRAVLRHHRVNDPWAGVPAAMLPFARKASQLGLPGGPSQPPNQTRTGSRERNTRRPNKGPSSSTAPCRCLAAPITFSMLYHSSSSLARSRVCSISAGCRASPRTRSRL